MAFQLGELINQRYRLLRPIGSGGFGRVFEAKDERTHKHVALKVIEWNETEDEAAVIRHRFAREVRALALLDHPNVLRLLDVSDANDPELWVVTELLRGENLQDVIDREGRLPERRIAEIAEGTLRALQAAHEVKVVHRDIKPGNIFLCDNGRVVLIDFGVARGTATAASLTMVKSVNTQLVGTPHFIAPEQLRGTAVSEAADLYSLGISLRYALSGELPFAGQSMTDLLIAIMEGRATSLSPELLGLKTHLHEALIALSMRDPEQRPPSAAAALDLVKRCRESRSQKLSEATRIETGPTQVIDTPTQVVAVPYSNETRQVSAHRLAGETGQGTRPPKRWILAGIIVGVSISLGIFFLTSNISHRGKAARPVEPKPVNAPPLPLPSEPEKAPAELPAPETTSTVIVSPSPSLPVPPVGPTPSVVPTPSPTDLPVKRMVGEGTLTLHLKQWVEVSIDGKGLGRKQVMARFTLAAGKHVLKVSHPTLGVHERSFEIKDKSQQDWSIDMKTEPAISVR